MPPYHRPCDPPPSCTSPPLQVHFFHRPPGGLAPKAAKQAARRETGQAVRRELAQAARREPGQLALGGQFYQWQQLQREVRRRGRSVGGICPLFIRKHPSLWGGGEAPPPLPRECHSAQCHSAQLPHAPPHHHCRCGISPAVRRTGRCCHSAHCPLPHGPADCSAAAARVRCWSSTPSSPAPR